MIHLTKDEYLSLNDANEKNVSTQKKYSIRYKKICETWKSPEDWLNCNKKIIYFSETNNSNIYWAFWSMKNQYKLPVKF